MREKYKPIHKTLKFQKNIIKLKVDALTCLKLLQRELILTKYLKLMTTAKYLEVVLRQN